MWYPLPVSWWYKYEKVCLFYLILFPVLLRQCSGSLPHFASTAAPAAASHLPAPLARPSTINLLSTSRLSLHFYLDALSLPHLRATLHLYKHPSTDTRSSKACNSDAEITAKHQPLDLLYWALNDNISLVVLLFPHMLQSHYSNRIWILYIRL